MSKLLPPWLRLLRLPAVLTVPGDVWVGSAWAGKEISVRMTLSVALLYLYGMVLNDLVDEARDREQRPERPLPAGEINKTSALVLCFVLGALACLLQPGFPLLLLLFLVTAYDLLKNVHLWLGAALMAACRAAVLWIGAGAPAPATNLWPLFLLWGALIFFITFLADKEFRKNFPAQAFSFVLTCFWLLAPFAALGLGRPRFLIFLPWILLAVLALQNYRQITEQGQMHPRNTGQWLSMLIPLQSVFLFAFAPVWQGAVILSLWPLLRWSLRKMQIS